MSKVIYTGAFVDSEEIERKLEECGIERTKLSRQIKDTHVTFQFRPKEVDETMFGFPVDIRVIGYGVNPQNEGLLVEITSANETVQKLCDQVKVPHITLSVSEDGKPVNTCYINFNPIKKPFSIMGIYGAFWR